MATKLGASGESIKDVVLRLRIEGDPGNEQRLRSTSRRIAGAAGGATVAGAAGAVGGPPTGKGLAANQQWLANLQNAENQRLQKIKQTTVDLAKEEDKRFRALGNYHMSVMRRQQQYATQAAQVTRQQASQQAQLASQQMATARQFQAAAASRQGMSRGGAFRGMRGGLEALRGVGHLVGAATLFGGDDESIQTAMAILMGTEATVHLARGLGHVGGAMRGFGAGRATIAGTLRGGRAIAGGLGLAGVGAGAGGLAAAGAAAAVGGGLGLGAIYGTARDIQSEGFMGGARSRFVRDENTGQLVEKRGFTGGIANLEAKAIGSIYGGLGFKSGGVMSLGGRVSTPWSAALDAREQEQKTNRMQFRLDQRRQAVAEQRERRGVLYEEANRDIDMYRVGTDISLQMSMGRRDPNLESTRQFALGETRKQIAGTEKTFSVRDREDEQGRMSDLQRIVQLRQREFDIVQGIVDAERAADAKRVETLQMINRSLSEQSHQVRQGMKGQQESLGELNAGERSRLGSLIDRYRASGSIAGFAPEDIESLKRFGGAEIRRKIEKQQQDIGRDFAASKGLEDVSTEKGALRERRRQIVDESNLFTRPQQPFRLEPKFNVTIHGIQADKLQAAIQMGVEKALADLKKEQQAHADSRNASNN